MFWGWRGGGWMGLLLGRWCLERVVWVHIRFFGNGGLWFRSYSGSLLERPKSKQKAFAPPLGTSPRLGVPSLRLWSVGRRDGPSLAQRG